MVADKLQSCSGISFKSQALYLFVYVTRYLGKPQIRLGPITDSFRANG
jgi:hypothetical protein